MKVSQALIPFKSILVLFAASVGVAPVEAKVRVSVAKFQDKTASGASVGPGCHGYSLWADRLGGAFSDLLVEHLGSDPRLEVMERDAIREIYDNEVALMNSEEDASVQRGKFQKAKIAFVGVVDGFEYCEGGGAGGLNVGRLLGVGDITPVMKKSHASVSVLIRAVDTTTGKVLAQARAKKKQSRKSLGLAVEVSSIDAGVATFDQTPLGEIIREAVQEAGNGVLAKLKISNQNRVR